MANAPTALLLGANDQQIAHLKNCLSDWQCVIVPLNDQGIANKCSTSAPPEVAILDAQDEVNTTLAICEQFRSAAKTATTPILLVINRYDIAQGNAVKYQGNTGFIFTPFDPEGLKVKIDGLLDT